jgi:hypothetical protein
LVRAVFSTLSGRKSASSSASDGLGVPSLSQSPPTSGPITGCASFFFASRLIRLAITLMRNFVGIRRPLSSTGSRRWIFLGTITFIVFLVECSDLT